MMNGERINGSAPFAPRFADVSGLMPVAYFGSWAAPWRRPSPLCPDSSSCVQIKHSGQADAPVDGPRLKCPNVQNISPVVLPQQQAKGPDAETLITQSSLGDRL